MQDRWQRIALIELLGVFGLVLVSAGVVCVNHMTTPNPQQAGVTALTLHQPGIFGVALAQGLVLAALLAVTVPISGGYLNPAVTLTLWALGRMESARAGILLAAQALGSLLAGGCLRLIFAPDILQTARFGTPHLNPLAYPTGAQRDVLAGAGIELLLTFFLVLAIFAALGQAGDVLRSSLPAGMLQTAAALFALPLTGAALNPARWLGPVAWETISTSGANPSPWPGLLIYLASPTLGALLAGFLWTRVAPVAEEPRKPPGKK